MRLKTKLLLAVVPTATTLIGTIAALTAHSAVERYFEQHTLDAASAATEIREALDGAIGSLTHDTALATARVMTDGDIASESPDLASLRAAHPAVTEVTLVDGAGHILDAATAGQTPPTNAPLPAEVLDAPTLTFAESRRLDVPGRYLIPLRLPGSQATGAHLVFSVDLGELVPAAMLREAARSGAIAVVDPERRIVSTSADGFRPWRLAPEDLDAMLTSSIEGRFQVVATNETRFRVQARPLGYGLIALHAYPKAPGDLLVLRVVLVSLMLFALAVWTVVVITDRLFDALIARPVAQLRATATAFADGELEYRMRPGFARDELGLLAASLEHMRRRLLRSREEASRLVNLDPLTGLPNRRSMQARLDSEISRISRQGEGRFALFFIDLDNFKAINDTMGHKAGDRLVTKVARRLVESVRGYDSVATAGELRHGNGAGSGFVARLGGDEFLILLGDLSELSDLARVAKRFYRIFEDPLYIDEMQVSVSLSIGIVVFPDNGRTPEELIKNADAAMYAAKSAGKNQYRFFDEEMEASARQSLTIENKLRKALSENRLTLNFQPQIAADGSEITGCEVLVRWFDEESGWISPAVFVPVAESSGLVHELGMWVITEACVQLHRWAERGIQVPRLSINLSSIQIASEGLADQILMLLKRLRIAPERIEFEMTETAVFDQSSRVFANLAALRAAGCRIALDDFGTGYSSLAWVQEICVDAVKIDRSFVTDIQRNPTHRAVVASVVELGRHLGLTTIAEGVETVEELDAVAELGCSEIQGYFFSRPLTCEALEDFLLAFHGVDVELESA